MSRRTTRSRTRTPSRTSRSTRAIKGIQREQISRWRASRPATCVSGRTMADVAQPTQARPARPAAPGGAAQGGAPQGAAQGGAAQGAGAQRASAAGAPAQQRVQVSPADVPDVPKLADDVVVTGAMEESAFEEEQYLVQRSGRFIQLTELLYRIVEQVYGQRSIEDIAREVKAADGQEVSADDVRKLIAEKLIPVG